MVVITCYHSISKSYNSRNRKVFMNYTLHTKCRVCGSDDLKLYIDLGDLPLSNNLCSGPIEIAEKYPLQVLMCGDCGLSQLSIVVDPQVLFGHYVYRSSINTGYVKHCRRMAADLKKEYGLTEDSFMVDIAGNDGALLREFKSEIGLSILNVDPAVNLGAICQATGIPTLTEFWSLETARKILNLDRAANSKSKDTGPTDRRADLITATNVFAHVDNVYDFMEGVRVLLKPNTGVLVMEFPYLIDFIDNNEFDTIYFEHLSYFSLRPLIRLCEKVGLWVKKVEKQDIHGGSVRVHIGHGKGHDNTVKDFILWNEYKLNFKSYTDFAANAKKTITEFRNKIITLKSHHYKIAAFAASAKGNTLLNCAGLTCGSISYIVDETPEKIGKYSPGTFIPVVSMLDMKKNPPDYLVILSWNFKEEIMRKCKDAGYTGKFIIPIPHFEIID